MGMVPLQAVIQVLGAAVLHPGQRRPQRGG
jgi:hypothetical protein